MAQSKTLKDCVIAALDAYRSVIIKDSGDPNPSYSTIILNCIAKAKKYDQLIAEKMFNNHC